MDSKGCGGGGDDVGGDVSDDDVDDDDVIREDCSGAGGAAWPELDCDMVTVDTDRGCLKHRELLFLTTISL